MHKYLWTFGEKAGSFIINLASSIFIARIISPDEFGQLTPFIATASVFAIIGEGGLSNYVIKTPKEQLDSCFSVNKAMSILVTVVSIFFSVFYIEKKYESLSFIYGAWVLYSVASGFFIAVLIRNQDYKGLFYTRLISPLFSLVTLYFLQFYLTPILLPGAFLLMNAIMRLLISKYYLIAIYKYRFRVKKLLKENIKEIIEYALPVLSASFISEGFKSFIGMSVFTKFSTQLSGEFNQARSQSESINGLALSSMSQLFFPEIVKARDIHSAITRHLSLVLYASLLLSLILKYLDKIIFTNLLGDVWIDAASIFTDYFHSWVFFVWVNAVLMNLLRNQKKTWIILRLEVVKKITGIVIVLIFLQFQDFQGLFLALLIASSFELYCNMLALRSVGIDLKGPLIWFPFLLILIGIIHLSNMESLVIPVYIFTCLYVTHFFRKHLT